MGFSRVVLSPEISMKKLTYIARNSPIEIQVPVHGEMCSSYSDQCYFSAMQGEGSNGRGKCAELCRRVYNAVGHTPRYPLSIKDNCLARHLNALDSMGVTAISIDCRQKRPEHTAIITGIYAKALHAEKSPSHEEMATLENDLTEYGLTDGYYMNHHGSDMFGMLDKKKNDDSIIFTTARRNYLNGEYQRVPVRFVGTIRKGKRIKLAGADDLKHTTVIFGPIPVPAFHKELSETVLQTHLHKTGGTPFYCAGVKSKVEPGLTLPTSSLNDLRRQVLSEILEQRKAMPARELGQFVPGAHVKGYSEPKVISVFLTNPEQLSDELISLQPDIIYLPINKINFDDPLISGLVENEKTALAVSFPHIIHDSEKKATSDLLQKAVRLGIKDVLIGNLGQIHLVRTHGMTVRGDYSLNVFNSESFFVLRDLGLKSATLPFELSLAQIRDLSKPIDTELIVYGRLPLMLTENCIIRNSTGACTCDSYAGLVDKDGSQFPILSENGCRNILLSSRKLFMADKKKAVKMSGAWARRLNFTTENAIECVSILKRYMGLSGHTPSNFTRGRYYVN
jgi:putative protease